MKQMLLDITKMNEKLITVNRCKVMDVCSRCRGSGEIDVGYHGSPEWEKCGCVNGKRPREFQGDERERLLLFLAAGGQLADLELDG